MCSLTVPSESRTTYPVTRSMTSTSTLATHSPGDGLTSSWGLPRIVISVVERACVE